MAQPTLSGVLSCSLKAVHAQLDLVHSLTADQPQRTVTYAKSLLEQTEALVIEQANKDVDSFNELVEHLEQLQSDLSSKVLVVEVQKKQLNEMTLKLSESDAELSTTQARYKLAINDRTTIATQLKALQALNPERLKKQLTEKKKELETVKAAINSSRQENNRLRRELVDSKSKLASMISVNTDLNTAMTDMQARIQRMDGDVEPARYIGGNGIEFYFYTFQYGLKTQSVDYDIRILNDIDWHIEVRTNTGIGIIVSVTEWAEPLFPIVEGFDASWPENLTEVIKQRIRELLYPTHPKLIQKIEWSESVLLTDLCINHRHLDRLISSGFNTLFDVVSQTPSKLAKKVKGFGLPTARTVYVFCIDLVKEWEKNHV